MIIDLSQIVFDNDMWEIDLANNNTLILNKIDESLVNSTEDATTEIKQINIAVKDFSTSEQTIISSVIGLETSSSVIHCDYEEYQGKLLTDENRKYCTLEVFDEEEE